MMWRNLLILACCFTSLDRLIAQEEDTTKAKVRMAKDAYYADRDKAETVLLGLLTRRLETAKKSGDLKTLEAVQAELDAFRGQGTLPKLVPIRDYEIAMKLARVKYENVLTANIKSLTQAGNIEAAKELDQQLKEFQTGAAKSTPVAASTTDKSSTTDKTANATATNKTANAAAVQEQIVTITSRKEDGYVIGPLAKGDKILLQYKSGMWKAWGGQATENPDKSTHKQCQLAIANLPAGSSSTIITNVANNTKETPFGWVADQNYENIVLRISDDGKLSDNPDKDVKYALRVIKSK